MKHNLIISLTLIFILLLSAGSVGEAIVKSWNNLNYFNPTNQQIKGGWIDKQDGITFLHLHGSPYELGYQHGSLLKEECLQNYRAFLDFAHETFGYSYNDFVELWQAVEEYVPNRYIEEMKGIADGAGMHLEKVAIANIMNMYAHCSGFVAWGPASVDQRLYCARSLDFPTTIQDPETGALLQENIVIIVRDPTMRYDTVDISFAGFVGSLGGINEKGITSQVLTSWSNDETVYGTPMVFRQRMVLDYADDITEAAHFLTSNMTRGWNFLVSDLKGPEGIVIESTANTYYLGQWNDPVESNHPFWQIDHVIRRTNIFLNSECAGTQRQEYNPQRFPILSTLLARNKMGKSYMPSFIPWTHFYALSKEIEENWGSINLTNSMKILRNLYQGKSTIWFTLAKRLGFNPVLYQWVVCPQTGNMLFSLTNRKIEAHENRIHQCNIYELMNTIPP